MQGLGRGLDEKHMEAPGTVANLADMGHDELALETVLDTDVHIHGHIAN